MSWLNALFLLLLGALVGWVPLLGPFALGFFAARAERGPRALVVLLPAAFLLVAASSAIRAGVQAAERYGVESWAWTSLSWLGSPLSAALGRPLTHMLAGSSLSVLLVLLSAPMVLGLLVGALTDKR